MTATTPGWRSIGSTTHSAQRRRWWTRKCICAANISSTASRKGPADALRPSRQNKNSKLALIDEVKAKILAIIRRAKRCQVEDREIGDQSPRNTSTAAPSCPEADFLSLPVFKRGHTPASPAGFP